MSRPRVDATLPIPPDPGAVPVLEGHEGALVLHGPAGPGRFLVEAGGVRVDGWERGHVDTVAIGGHSVLTGLSASAGAVANVVATPSALRRERVGPLGSVQEILVAVGSQDGAVMQWRSSVRREGSLHIHFTLAGGRGETRYRLADHALVLRSESEPEDRVVLVHPSPTSWTVRDSGDGGLAVDVEAPTDGAYGTVTLAVAAGGPGSGGLPWLAHLDAHQRRGQCPPWDDGSVRTTTGVAELDHGMGWLTARIASGRASSNAPPDRLLWWGLGALACGLTDAARSALEALEAGDAPWRYVALLAARIASTTGDQGPATRMAHRLLSDPAADDGGCALAGVARAALADAVRYAASDEDIEAIRSRGASPPPTRGVALPMAGAAQPGADGPSWLSGILEEAGVPEVPTDALDAAVATVRGLAGGQGEAYVAWRERVAGGLAHGPMGKGTWDTAAGEGAPVAGALACALVHGVLGWDPDAPVGRLTLRPSFPRHVRAFTVHGLAVGDTRIGLEYRREGPDHTFTFEPEKGRVPSTLVFEPRVAASAVTEVHLDGQQVELDVKKYRDRTGPSVQIPLDGARILRLTASGKG